MIHHNKSSLAIKLSLYIFIWPWEAIIDHHKPSLTTHIEQSRSRLNYQKQCTEIYEYVVACQPLKVHRSFWHTKDWLIVVHYCIKCELLSSTFTSHNWPQLTIFWYIIVQPIIAIVDHHVLLLIIVKHLFCQPFSTSINALATSTNPPLTKKNHYFDHGWT